MNEQHASHPPGLRADPPGLRAWLGLLATLGPVLLVAMDGSVLFLAMPRVTEALSPSADQALWIMDIYGFAVGSLLVAFGNIGDRYGRLKLLMIGVAGFGAASAGAAFAPGPELLIAFRALMGVSGATLLPSALAVLGELFTDPLRRARAIGIFAATFAAGFAIGPFVGGQLLSRFWWGSVFLINIPVVLLFLLLAPILLREVRATRPGRVDTVSILLSAAGLLLTIYAIKHAAAEGPTTTALTAGIGGVVALDRFVRRQGRLEHPLIDFRLFQDRVFAIAIITGLLPLAAWSAVAYLASSYLQSVLALPVLHTALLTIPGAAVLTATCVFAPALAGRTGKRSALLICHFCIAAGLLLLLPAGVSGGTGWYIASTVVAGVGYGISFSIVADTAIAAVPTERAGSAAALAETSNEIGNALGIALLGSLSTLLFRFHGPDLAGTLDETLRIPGLTPAVIGDAKAAFVTGLHAVTVIAAVLHASLGFLTLRWIPKTRPGTGITGKGPRAADADEEHSSVR